MEHEEKDDTPSDKTTEDEQQPKSEPSKESYQPTAAELLRQQHGRRVLTALAYEDFASLDELSGIGPAMLRSAEELGWITSREVDGRTIAFVTDTGRYRRRQIRREIHEKEEAKRRREYARKKPNAVEEDDWDDDDWDDDWSKGAGDSRVFGVLERIAGHLEKLDNNFGFLMVHVAASAYKAPEQKTETPVPDEGEEVDGEDWDDDLEEGANATDGWTTDFDGADRLELHGYILRAYKTVGEPWTWELYQGISRPFRGRVKTQQEAQLKAIEAADRLHRDEVALKTK